MQWFRSYVGTHSDPKIATVARKVGLHRTIVLSVWLAIEECACAALNRGSMASMDFDDVATALDIESEQVQAIVIAFKAKNMIAEDGTLTAWQKRQFQSDSDPTNGQRQRKFRDKQARNASVTDDVTDTKRDVTTRADTEQTQSRTDSEIELRGAAPLAAASSAIRLPKEKSKRKTTLANEFVISPGDERYRYAHDLGMSDSVMEIECDKFENHHKAKGSLMADWDAAWKNWCRNWQTFSQQRLRG